MTKSDGSIVALWLDHRDLAATTGTAPMNHAEHQPGSYPIVVTTDSAMIVGWTSGPAGQSVIRMKRLID